MLNVLSELAVPLLSSLITGVVIGWGVMSQQKVHIEWLREAIELLRDADQQLHERINRVEGDGNHRR